MLESKGAKEKLSFKECDFSVFFRNSSFLKKNFARNSISEIHVKTWRKLGRGRGGGGEGEDGV